ncbi:hypothetical protein [Sandaracinus amylolyticus]|uniref:hypothetical protein n=1 Tax=Sandaracinus amylolyticus TaxID=927083 RepID=UPI001F43DB51|nr:hypothetical protein [Sandaracinus amylolyticus]UJR83640.1 Hypothetical protein I5071_57090 [Sandaracinus amylolyticus]
MSGDLGPALIGDDDPEPILPGYRNIVIYCDESGMHRAPYYGFGSLWTSWGSPRRPERYNRQVAGTTR